MYGRVLWTSLFGTESEAVESICILYLLLAVGSVTDRREVVCEGVNRKNAAGHERCDRDAGRSIRMGDAGAVGLRTGADAVCKQGARREFHADSTHYISVPWGEGADLP